MVTFTLHPQACPLMVSLVEEHMAQIIRQATSVNRHCKRARRHADDEDDTGPPHTSAQQYRPTIRRRLHAADVNMALQLLSAEPLYATDVVPPNPDDASTRVDLADYLRRAPDATHLHPPSEVGLQKHWLAVDGKQPPIPQNPTFIEPEGPTNAPASTPSITPSPVANTDGSGLIQIQQLQSSLLSEELLLYFVRLMTSLDRGDATPAARREQDAVLFSLAHDTGLQELVPFLVRHVQQTLYPKMAQAQLQDCRSLLRLVRALLQNTTLHVELFLHELLPAVMTCVVAKLPPADAHQWALRREAAAALQQACQRFGTDYVTLKARVLKTLCQAATPTNESLPSRYGGMVGLTIFGPKAIDAFLLPTLLPTWCQLETTLQALQESDTQDWRMRRAMEYAIHMCQRAALEALGVLLPSWSSDAADDAVDDMGLSPVEWTELQEQLGDRMVPLHGLVTEYASCFV